MSLVRASLVHAALVRASLALAALILSGAMAGETQARVVVGFGFGVPLFWPGPVVIAPPGYYAPEYYAPGYYTPGYYQQPAATFSYVPPQARPRSLTPRVSEAGYCQAGPYTCPLVAETPLGGACACPGHDGRRVRGQAY